MNWILLALLIIGQSPEKSAQTNAADNYLFGSADSPVRLELFSDFQCPSCRTFFLDTVVRLKDEYASGNKVALVGAKNESHFVATRTRLFKIGPPCRKKSAGREYPKRVRV